MMTLSGGGARKGHRLGEPMSREDAEHLVLENGAPFIPAAQMASGEWFFSCTQLQTDGRCGAYEDRPQVCRSYVAGSDPLCVHYWAADESAEVAKAA
jgi:Fe-S-cluster containining protein